MEIFVLQPEEVPEDQRIVQMESYPVRDVLGGVKYVRGGAVVQLE